MTEDRQQRIRQALAQVQPLSAADIDTIVAGEFSLPESVVLGYLRAACHLLARDDLFTIVLRGEAWARWRAGMEDALDLALLYRENRPLLLAFAVIQALLPEFYPHASLPGFKALRDVLHGAERRGRPHKLDRRERPFRPDEALTRTTVPRYAITENAGTEAAGTDTPGEVWVVIVRGYPPEPLLAYVQAVLPVTAHSSAELMMIVPRL